MDSGHASVRWAMQLMNKGLKIGQIIRYEIIEIAESDKRNSTCFLFMLMLHKIKFVVD